MLLLYNYLHFCVSVGYSRVKRVEKVKRVERERAKAKAKAKANKLKPKLMPKLMPMQKPKPKQITCRDGSENKNKIIQIK